MKVAVTGATGFLGVPLVKALLLRGDEVKAVVRSSETAKQWLGVNSNLHIVEANLFDEKLLASLFAGVDVVFHVAGFVSYDEDKRSEVHKVNVDGTRAVMSAALKAHVPRVVHTSSIVAVGISWDGSELDEKTAFNADALNLEYFNAKKEAEDVVQNFVRKGLNAIIMNPATIVGFPEDSGRPGGVQKSIEQLAKARVLIPGGNCFVDVRDVVAGHLLALDKGQAGERYILGGENISNARLIKILAQRAGRARPITPLPVSCLQVFSRLIKTFEKLGIVLPVGSQLITRVSGFYLFFSSAKAENALGWTARSPLPAIYSMAALPSLDR